MLKYRRKFETGVTWNVLGAMWSLGFVAHGIFQFYLNNVADAIFYISLAVYIQSLQKRN